MRTYNKRIGFIVSYQTLIPHGGIGQFAKSFCELMDAHNIKVDIITDKEPNDNDFVKSLKANIIAPLESLPYSLHSSIYMYGDTFCYERMANFRNAIVEALEHNIYDAFICNTYESVQVCSTMGLEDLIQIIAYTHLESQIFKDTKNPFLYNTNAMMRQQLSTPGIFVGTQSKHNQLNLCDTSYHLPIPITERGLLEEHHKTREGVLFVGRWEEGKNPELFIDLIEQTKLPAKVMTSPNGVKKFEDRLQKIGAQYEVRASIVGQEKVDFMTSARLAFNPSTVESYGMAFYEQMIQMPTVALENQRWTKNFDNGDFFTVNKKNMAQTVLDLYNNVVDAKTWYDNGILSKYRKIEEDVFHKWNECFNEFKTKQSNSNTAKICNFETVRYDEFMRDLGRKPLVCIDDIRSVLANKHKFNLIYTDDNTYLSKDPIFQPKEEVAGESLFNFS
jgi:glycosyltransferase involved in cell wall biosynthesis